MLHAPIAPNAHPLTLCTPDGRPLGEWDFAPGDALSCFALLRTSPRGVAASVVLTRDAPLRCGARLVVARKGSVLLPMHAPRLGAREGFYVTRAARVVVERAASGGRILSARDEGPCPLAPAALFLARKAETLGEELAPTGERLASHVGALLASMLGAFAVLADVKPDPACAA